MQQNKATPSKKRNSGERELKRQRNKDKAETVSEKKCNLYFYFNKIN